MRGIRMAGGSRGSGEAAGKRSNRPVGRNLRPGLELLEPRLVLAVGGGVTAAGFLGEYFANPDLAGAPAFARRDVRIDFDWAGIEAPGGSSSPGFRELGPTGFSVRWTGQLVPSYAETYQISTASAGGVRLWIKPVETSSWTKLVDNWAVHETVQVDTASYKVALGKSYDLKIEYRAAALAPSLRLTWSSPSTPPEVIDPLSVAGFNFLAYKMPVPSYANAFLQGRDQWLAIGSSATVPTDAGGWPLADARRVVWEGLVGYQMEGTYRLEFQGKAQVDATYGNFRVGTAAFGPSLPSGAGYDPVTNTTSALLELPTSTQTIFTLAFAQTQRSPADPLGSGVTQVAFMRPTTIGGSQPYTTDTRFDNTLKRALESFTVIRFGTSNDKNFEAEWSDRTFPTYSNARKGFGSMAWEDLVRLCNETGTDLYLQIPMNASDHYVECLARLTRFGSDGINPYDTPQPNPLYPGLNSNLRVYVEWSNETWNRNFTQYADAVNRSRQAVQDNTPEGQIINYDGKAPNGDPQRWTALRTVRASQIFRSVWGDQAMGEKVRVLLEFQYNNANNTAINMYNFLDRYFNNGDGLEHVPDPKPVSYYVWGGGGHVYYDGSNSRGYQSAIVAANSSFETPTLAAGAKLVRPSDASWTFSGNSGIVREAAKYAAVGSVTPGTAVNPLTATTAVGFSFTVGSKEIAVYQLGRWVLAGNKSSHRLTLIRQSDLALLASATVSTSGATAGKFAYAMLAVPVVLQPHTTYYLLSDETPGQDRYHDQDTVVKPNSRGELKINGAMSAVVGKSGVPSTWSFTAGASGQRGFGPVDLRYAVQKDPQFGFLPDTPVGAQTAYLSGTGSLQQKIHFPTPGIYALEITAAGVTDALNPIDVYLDGLKITPQTFDPGSLVPATSPWQIGKSYSKDYRGFDTYGTLTFQIPSPATKTIRFVGRGTSDQTVFIDNVKITSLDSLFKGAIPYPHSSSSKSSYKDLIFSQSRYPIAFGLKVVAYEGSWWLGRDFDVVPLQNHAKYLDARAQKANADSLNIFTRSGGDLYVFGTPPQWMPSDTANSRSYPLVAAIDAAAMIPPRNAENGTKVPARLSPDQMTLAFGLVDGGTRLGQESWVVWNIVVSKAGVYTIRAQSSAGGTARLALNDAITLDSGPSEALLSGQAFLTVGVHSIKVKSASGSFPVPAIEVIQGAATSQNQPRLFPPAGDRIADSAGLGGLWILRPPGSAASATVAGTLGSDFAAVTPDRNLQPFADRSLQPFADRNPRWFSDRLSSLSSFAGRPASRELAQVPGDWLPAESSIARGELGWSSLSPTEGDDATRGQLNPLGRDDSRKPRWRILTRPAHPRLAPPRPGTAGPRHPVDRNG